MSLDSNPFRSMMAIFRLGALAFAVLPTAGHAQVVDKYHISPEERATCQSDANTFCGATFPDEDRLIVCMKANQARLTPACLKTLTAGLHKRHLS